MAIWNGQRRSGNVSERSGSGQALGGGAIFYLLHFIFSRFGIGGVVVAVGGYLALSAVGIDPLGVMGGGGQVQERPTNLYADEVRAVVGSTEDVWRDTFPAQDLGTYRDPQVVMFDGRVQTGCGLASSAVGPFYCPADRHIYFDTRFFRELETRFNAAGDFPRAYVIAHEVGHHVQTLLGTSDRVRSAQSGASEAEANRTQVRMELQADCFAGLWAGQIRARLEEGDIAEALAAAAAIGDDNLQRQGRGEVRPETFTHGTSAQRQRWFTTGYRSGGQVAACDTFSGPYRAL